MEKVSNSRHFWRVYCSIIQIEYDGTNRTNKTDSLFFIEEFVTKLIKKNSSLNARVRARQIFGCGLFCIQI